eukprot:COSAG01_NODE_7420_length_3215_cov_1523.875802_5_plen_73_part_00
MPGSHLLHYLLSIRCSRVSLADAVASNGMPELALSLDALPQLVLFYPSSNAAVSESEAEANAGAPTVRHVNC